ncbi:hypothetical protein [Acidaminococcus sp.]|uniref:hypothetical protein n=1 Tax=Acidaminococcus sp. TaxID=1872103 RepID=UPI003D7E454B
MKAFLLRHFRKIKYGLLVLLAGFLVLFWLAYIASIHAAQIFNREIAKQDFLDGTITVERLTATPLGHVRFYGLEWKESRSGNRITVPSGSFHVKPLDIILRRINTRTIQRVELDNTDIDLTFDKNMHVRGIKAAELPLPLEEHGRKKKFDIKLKNVDVAVKLNHCKMTARYKERVHTFEDVNADLAYNSADKLTIDFSTGELGGTLEGQGVDIQGDVDLKPAVSTYDLKLGIKNLNPSSLGTGLDVHERVTASANVTGKLPEPVIVGELYMPNLNLPGLKFTKVKGSFKYQDGKIEAQNVTADIFEGTCDAEGSFNIDTKAYRVNVMGHDLHSEDATNIPYFRTLVQLDLKMLCDGDNRSTLTYGSFTSGKGIYAIIKFNSIKGTFSNQYKQLKFSDVVIKSDGGDIVAPQFELVNGKLHLGNLYYVAPGGGRAWIHFFS